MVEILNNNVILFCRSNAKRTQNVVTNNHLDPKHQAHNPQNQRSQTTGEQDILTQQDDNSKPTAIVTWLTPNEKQVIPDLKDKFEILETGDLLIKDLRWSDMGNYICTVSNDQSSDSITTFLYPAAPIKH